MTKRILGFLAVASIFAAPDSFAAGLPQTANDGSSAIVSDPMAAYRIAKSRHAWKLGLLRGDAARFLSFSPSIENHKAPDNTWSNVRADSPTISLARLNGCPGLMNSSRLYPPTRRSTLGKRRLISSAWFAARRHTTR